MEIFISEVKYFPFMDSIGPVSFEDLKMIFSGSKFTRRLSKAMKENIKFHQETGFNVVRVLMKKDLVYGRVFSSNDAINNPGVSIGGSCFTGLEDLVEKKKLNIYDKMFFLLFHFILILMGALNLLMMI